MPVLLHNAHLSVYMRLLSLSLSFSLSLSPPPLLFDTVCVCVCARGQCAAPYAVCEKACMETHTRPPPPSGVSHVLWGCYPFPQTPQKQTHTCRDAPSCSSPAAEVSNPFCPPLTEPSATPPGTLPGLLGPEDFRAAIGCGSDSRLLAVCVCVCACVCMPAV